MAHERFDRREWLRRTGLAGVAAGALTPGASALRSDLAQAPGRVPTTELGTTGERIPILVMGCGQTFSHSYDRVLHRAFNEGVYYLDTAVQYDNGQSHDSVGVFQEQVGRENVWITSKVPMETRNTSTVEHYLKNFEKMMPVLRTDYLDAFFMHGLNNADMLEPDYIRMADDLKKQEKIKFFGFSCHHGNVVELMNKAAKIGAPGVDMIMFRFSYASYGDLELNKAIDACKNAGIGLIAMKTQNAIPDEQEKVVQFRSENFTLPQAKLKAVWADERIDAAISEMTNIQQVEENTAAAKSTDALAMDEFVQLNRLAALTAPYACKGCEQICESKVDGNVRIADRLRYLMYDESYGSRATAKRLYGALDLEEKALAGVDFRAATEACPQGIDIAGRLAEAERRLA